MSEETSAEMAHRVDFVWGIATAAAIGFVLNLLANLYYDLYIVRELSWDDVNQNQVAGLVLALVVLFAFLRFLIYDFKNPLAMNGGFIARFYEFFLYKYLPGRFLRVATAVTLLLMWALGWLFALTLVVFLVGKIGVVIVAACVITSYLYWKIEPEWLQMMRRKTV